MKKTVTYILTMCLLLVTGCTGNSGAASGKAVDVNEITVMSSEKLYEVEKIDAPDNVHFTSAPTLSGERVYIIGQDTDNYYLYSLAANGSNAVRLASAPISTELWRAVCTIGERLYVLDGANNTIIELDKNGELVSRFTLPSDLAPMYLAAADSMLYVVGLDNVVAFSPENIGEMVYSIGISTGATIGKLPDGRVALCQNKDGVASIAVLDDAAKGFAEEKSLSTTFAIVGSGDDGLILQNASALYSFDFTSAALTKLFDLSLLGLQQGGYIWPTGNEQYIYTGSAIDTEAKLYLIKPASTDQLAQNEGSEPVTLTLATVGELPIVLDKFVLGWNQEHPECRIEIKDYSAYNSNSDDRAAEMRLVADIGSGNAPDLYNFSYGDGAMLNADVYTRRGLLENLYPYIDKDTEIDRSDFLPGPLSAQETNGALYSVAPCFYFSTCIAALNLVGDSENWTYENLETVAAENGLSLFNKDISREKWLDFAICTSGKKLVNWENVSCYFDSPYFVRMLELAYNMPADSTVLGGTAYRLVQESGALLFVSEGYGDFSCSSIPAWAYGENNYAYVGMPETGNSVVPYTRIGISSQSAHKEACWRVVRELLLPGTDEKYGYAGFEIPLRQDDSKTAIERELKQAQARAEQSGSTSPIQRKQMEYMLEVISETDNLYQQDVTLWSIVNEEFQRYLNGKSDAQDTAASIQSRVSIYLAEQG